MNEQLSVSPGKGVVAVIVLLLFVYTERLAAQDWPEISFSKPIDGFAYPTHIASAHDGSDRLFVAEETGRIRIVKNGTVLPTPFLDISSRLGKNVVGAQGVLSIAFPPDYANKGHFYVNYATGGTLYVARYRITSNPDIADAGSEQIILNDGPFQSQWGGELAFGPLDGFLYFGSGSSG